MNIRPIDREHDKSLLLELHCEVNYACDTSWSRELPYEEYKGKWMSTSQPEQFYSALLETLDDPRTIAELAEDDDGRLIGYVWATFADVPEYALTIAEIRDFYIAPDYRREGYGMRLLAYVEDSVRRSGANLLRSETGTDNAASRSLHRKYGFGEYRICLEKRL